MRQVRNGFAQTRDELGRFGNRSQEAFDQMATGGKAFALGMAGLGILSATIPSAAVFGEKIAEITTLTDEASLNSGFLSDEVMRLNAAYGGSTAKQAKAMYDGISAGAGDAAQATALLEASNRLAIAGVTDVGTSLDGLTSAMNAYGQSFDNAGSFADTMMIAVQKGKTTIPELSAVVGRVAPTASALGVSFDEMGAALAAVTAKGLKTEEAATGIKAALSNIIKPTADAEKEAKRLGVTFTAAAVREKGFAGVLKEITGSSKFNEDSLSQLFGSVEGLNVALALTSEGGAKFNDALEAMKNKTGFADKAFEKMAATTAFQGKRFMGLAENAKIMIGQALEPMAAAILRVVNGVLEGFGKIPKPIRDFVVKIAAGAAGVTALAGAVLAAKNAIAIAGAAMKTFGLASSSGMLSAFGPVLLVIAAVAAAIYAFKYAIDQNIGGIGDVFNDAVSWVKGFFTSISQLLTTGTLDEDMSAAFLSGEDSAVQWAVSVYQVIERVVNFFSGMVEGFKTGLKAAQPAFDALAGAFGKLGDALGLAIGPAKDASAEFDSAGQAGKGIGETLAKGIELAADVLTVLVEIATGVVEMWNDISASLGSVKSALGEVGTAADDVTGKVGALSAEAGVATPNWQTLGQVIGGTVAVALQFTASQISAMMTALTSLGKVFSGVIDIFIGTATGDWPRVWNGYKSVVYGAVQGMVDMLLGLVQIAADVGDKINSALGIKSTGGTELRAWRDKMREGFKASLGVDEYVATTKAPPPGGMANVGSVPAIANIGPTQADVAAGAATSTAAAAAAKAAIGSLPPFVANAVINMDGEQIGRLVLKANASDASRGGGASAVDVG